MRMHAASLGIRGLGDVAQSNPTPGTYYDLNCPNSCYLLGNVLDTSILGAECWPCHNVCPAGTVWDTAALRCSSAPGSTNPVVPVTEQSPAVTVAQSKCAAGGGTWDPVGQACSCTGWDPTSMTCSPIAPYLQYIPWIVGGIALLAITPLLLNMGRR